MVRRRISWVDVIFWLALLLLAFWIIAKLFGLINTPAIVEIIPYISAVFIAGSIWQQFKHVKKDVGYIKSIVKRFDALEHEHKLVMNGKLKIRH